MDLSFIAEWFSSTNSFFQDIWDFVNSGVYQFFKDAMVIFTKAAIYSYFQFKIFMVNIAYDVVQEIITDTGVVAVVQSAWSSIPGDMQSMLAFFKIPQGLTLVFTAIPTRWAMKFIPGIGS